MIQAKYFTAIYKAQQARSEADKLTKEMQEALKAFLLPKGFDCEVDEDYSGERIALYIFGPNGTDSFFNDDMQYAHWGELQHPELDELLEEFRTLDKEKG